MLPKRERTRAITGHLHDWRCVQPERGSLEPLDLLSQSGYRRRFEQTSQWQLDTEQIAQTYNDLCCQQGMAAQFEEIVLCPNLTQLQYVRPDPTYRLLGGRSR